MAERIQVTTEELLIKKENWELLLGQVAEEITVLEGILGGVQNCFDAEVVSVFQKQYRKRQEQMRNALQDILKHVEKLGQITEIYGETERSNRV